MDIEEYKSALNAYETEIEELEQTIRKIRDEIEEVEEARESASKFRTDFDSYVDRKKQKNHTQTNGSLVRAFSSFIGKATSLLTGNEYNQANEKVEEISRLIENKLKNLNEDLHYCRKELNRLKSQRNELYSDYKMLLKVQREKEVE